MRPRSVLRVLLALLALFACVAAQAQSGRNLAVQAATGEGRRLALVIGNDGYQQVPKLNNARADARAMAKALEDTGFKVTLRLDVGDKALKEAMRTFKNQVRGGDEAVFFFSGHGVQLGAANYLLPIDIGGESEDQIKDDALPLQRVLDDLQDQKARFSLAIVDACRNNPFSGRGRAIGGRGLAPTSAATGQMVIYSAGTGQQALDRLSNSDSSPNGLFTRVFLKEMSKPGVPVDRVLRGVRDEVVRLARSVGHEQVPALYDQALGEFYFRPGSGGTNAAVSPGLTPAPAADPATLELALWESVRDSNRKDELQAYLDQYPSGRFAAVARSRLQRLQPQAPAQIAVAPAQPVAPSSRPTELPAGAPSGYPSRPLRLVVPYPAGGTSDIVARLLATELSQRLTQPVIVDNRPGASGMIGTETVARSAPDGYTLLVGGVVSFSIAPQLARSSAVNPLSDLAPVAALTQSPLMLVVANSSRSGTLHELVGSMRRQPGRINCANIGLGSTAHIATIALEKAAGVQCVHIPYKGTAPALTDLLGGQVEFMFIDPPTLRNGLRALAVASERRLASHPDVPTFAELGYPDVALSAWTGVFAPAGTPSNVVRYLNTEIRRVLQRPDIAERLTTMMALPATLGGSEEFAAFVRNDSARMGRWIKAGDIRID